jgi:hypothetical protein
MHQKKIRIASRACLPSRCSVELRLLVPFFLMFLDYFFINTFGICISRIHIATQVQWNKNKNKRKTSNLSNLYECLWGCMSNPKVKVSSTLRKIFLIISSSHENISINRSWFFTWPLLSLVSHVHATPLHYCLLCREELISREVCLVGQLGKET